MNDGASRILLLFAIVLSGFTLRAQQLLPNSEGSQADTLTLWHSGHSDNKFQIGPADTYSLARDFFLPESLAGKNAEAELFVRAQLASDGTAWMVLTVMAADSLRYWHALPINAEPAGVETIVSGKVLLPRDYLDQAFLRVYLWNPDSVDILVGQAFALFRPHEAPHFLPPAYESEPGPDFRLLFQTPDYALLYSRLTGQIVLADPRGHMLAGPFQWIVEITNNGHAISSFSDRFVFQGFRSREGEWYAAFRTADRFTSARLHVRPLSSGAIEFRMAGRMRKTAPLSRMALVVPVHDDIVMAFDGQGRQYAPMHETSVFIGHGGMLSGAGQRRLALMQARHVASAQVDMANRRLIANLHYADAQPFIRYPRSETLRDSFSDLSHVALRHHRQLRGKVDLFVGRGSPAMPLLMAVPGGAEAAVVFTEHADWTDVRTQRAVHFGSDTIAHPSRAQGGFDKYGIPVTKSVFYHNPEQITNMEASRGMFPGRQASLQEDDFRSLMDTLHYQGHEICLHTPEQHSSKRSWMRKSLKHMQLNYGSATWIDHGYNNHPDANRENLVGDGLIRHRRHYSADLWRKYGIRYLWNPAPEELQRFAAYGFDGNYMIPYPGFSAAFPSAVFTTHPLAEGFLLWNTTGTLEMPDDGMWDYAFSPARLERLLRYHSIWINHIYPAWALSGKGFWTWRADSSLVAMPGFDRALARLDALRKSGRLHLATLGQLAKYHEALRHVEVIPISDNQIRVINHNPFAIKGLSFVVPSEKIVVQGAGVSS